MDVGTYGEVDLIPELAATLGPERTQIRAYRRIASTNQHLASTVTKQSVHKTRRVWGGMALRYARGMVKLKHKVMNENTRRSSCQSP